MPAAMNIPPSSVAVTVSIINTGARLLNIPWSRFAQPSYKGLEVTDVPSFSFLVEHPSGRRILFDLSVREDWRNLTPRVAKLMKDGGWIAESAKDVGAILQENGVGLDTIEAAVWR